MNKLQQYYHDMKDGYYKPIRYLYEELTKGNPLFYNISENKEELLRLVPNGATFHINQSQDGRVTATLELSNKTIIKYNSDGEFIVIPTYFGIKMNLLSPDYAICELNPYDLPDDFLVMMRLQNG